MASFDNYNGADFNDDMDMDDRGMPYYTAPSGNGFGRRFETRLPSSTGAEFEDEADGVAPGDDPDEPFYDPEEAFDNPNEDLDIGCEDTMSAAKEKIRKLRMEKDDRRKETNGLKKKVKMLERQVEDKDDAFKFFFVKMSSNHPEIASILKQHGIKYVPAPDRASIEQMLLAQNNGFNINTARNLTVSKSLAMKEKELAAMATKLHQQQMSFSQNQFQAGSTSYVFNNCNFDKFPSVGPQVEDHAAPPVANRHAAGGVSSLEPRLTEASVESSLRDPKDFANGPKMTLTARP